MDDHDEDRVTGPPRRPRNNVIPRPAVTAGTSRRPRRRLQPSRMIASRTSADECLRGRTAFAAVRPRHGAKEAPTMHQHERDRRIAELIRMLHDPDVDIRLEAAGRLGRIGSRALPAVPWLAGLLNDAEPVIRKVAALALGEIGPAAAAAVPALRAALLDTEAAVRRRAAIALAEIAAPDVAPPQAA